jgi:hypothetical protein
MSSNHTDELSLSELIKRSADWPDEARQELVESMIDIEARYHGVFITTKEDRGGPGCLNRFSASISGASAGVRLPSGEAAA